MSYANNFMVSIYCDSNNGIIRGSGRWRWAVYCKRSGRWYFASRYGKRAAQAFCNRLNASN